MAEAVNHRLFDYRGVIVDVDPMCQVSEQWYEFLRGGSLRGSGLGFCRQQLVQKYQNRIYANTVSTQVLYDKFFTGLYSDEGVPLEESAQCQLAL